MPFESKYCLASKIVCSPKWKIDAASTALALPILIPWCKCSKLPTPPEAITGMFTRLDTF